LKFCQRRRLIGDSVKRRGKGSGPTGPVGSTAGVRVRGSMPPPGTSLILSARVLSSNSNLPRLEIDARIDPGVSQVGNQINDEADEREDIEVGEHNRIVAVEHTLEA